MPVLAAAFCPHPPLLVPELAGGAASELDGLRAACHEAVRTIAAHDAPVLVIGPAEQAQEYGSAAAGTFAPWGVDVRSGGDEQPTLPLSLTVGAWLLDRSDIPLGRRRYVAVTGEGAVPAASDGPLTLLVMADGSSTRTMKAPGGFREEAEPFDEAVVAALRSGDPTALAQATDSVLGRTVGAGGVAAWVAAGRLVGGQPSAVARVLTDEAPYGVAYPVAVWTW